MTGDLLIKNGTLCNAGEEPFITDIYIKDGIIAGIAENIELVAGVPVIDAAGLLVAPGLIDMYCKIGEPGDEHKEDIASAVRSAARGGYTTITCQPNTDPAIDNKTVLGYINTRAREQQSVNVLPYGSVTKGCRGAELAEIGQMVKAGVVAVSDGGETVGDTSLMRKILLYSSMFDVPVITMCEDKALAASGVMNRGRIATKTGLVGIPSEAEETIAARNIILAGHCGARLHITHVSTAGTADIIGIAKRIGINVTGGTCPHYFSLSEEIVESYNTFAKVRPPLRTDADIARVKRGLVEGDIDIIASGHTPTTIESKQGEFDRASFGISALETAFCASFTELVKNNVLTLPSLLNKMSLTPAKILGLSGKGAVKPGLDGDIFIFSEKEPFRVRAAEFASKAKFSLFEGRTVYGQVLYTVVGGNVVYTKELT